MQQEAIEKIAVSMQDCKEKRVPVEPIARYLTQKCGEDEEFATLVTQEHKTLAKCFNFVFGQVKKHLNGADGWLDDNDVYLMAADYFSLDDEQLERQKVEEEAKRAQQRQQQEEERRQKAVEAKAQKDRAAQEEKDKKAGFNQLSLF